MDQADMDNETAAKPARPRLNPFTKAARRERIFSRRLLGASCADIARQEGLSQQRVRKIFADALRRREIDDLPDHALIQLVRLKRAYAVAAQAVQAGNLKAIRPYIQVIEQFDRYRKAAARPEVYNAAARERLFAKLNRVAAEIEAETRKGA